MATIPLSGTNIRLLSGVPFHSDYKHTRWFDSKTDQTNYFLSKPVVHSIIEANFQRVEGKTFIRVDQGIDQLRFTNYVMFQNAHYSSKWFYGFVTHLEYKQKNLTFVHFEIDVFQTWCFDMSFKPSYVVREHRPLWNSDGSPVINTIDEGLNYGTDYETVSVTHVKPNDEYKWLVIVSKTPFHDSVEKNKITPTVIGTPQPLSYYLVPFKDDDTVPNVYLEKYNSGVIISKPTDVLKGVYTDAEAVNNVVAIFITEHTGIKTNFTNNTFTFPLSTGDDIQMAQVSDGGSSFFNCLYVKKVLKFYPEHIPLGNKYAGYNEVTESKLLMYPYVLTTIDDFKGNRINLKNEYINNNDLTLTLKGSIGTSNMVSYGVSDYNLANTAGFEYNVMDEFALINNSPSDVPVLTDLLSAFLQGNRNSILNQRQQLVWNGMYDAIGGTLAGFASGNPIGAAQAGAGVVQGAGNTVLQLKAIQAKQKDIANVPPQIAKMGSNTSYVYGNEFNGVYVIRKQIKKEYQDQLAHFFNMYGYKTNEVKIPNFHTRQNWNYIETKSCVIQGNFNNEDLQELKNVFDNGITLWHTDDIGNYSLVNEVI